MYMCACICVGPTLMLGFFFDCSSAWFLEARSLSRAQGSGVKLVFLAIWLQLFPVSTFSSWNCRGLNSIQLLHGFWASPCSSCLSCESVSCWSIFLSLWTFSRILITLYILNMFGLIPSWTRKATPPQKKKDADIFLLKQSEETSTRNLEMNFKMIFHESLNLAFKRTMGKVLCEAWFCLDLGGCGTGLCFALFYG